MVTTDTKIWRYRVCNRSADVDVGATYEEDMTSSAEIRAFCFEFSSLTTLEPKQVSSASIATIVPNRREIAS